MNAKREKRGPYVGGSSYKAPYRVTLDDITADKLRTPAGRRVVVCPATYREDAICVTCELCQKSSAARAIVAFPSHGSKFKTIDIVVSK